MLSRIILFVIIVVAGYWYWSGPWQEKTNPSYQSILRENDRKMAECIRAEAYVHGATGAGTSAVVAEQQCAEKYNVYELDGHWHNHDMARPD